MKTYGDLLELGCQVLQQDDVRLSKNELIARWSQEVPPHELHITAGLLEAGNVLISSVREILLSHVELTDEVSVLIKPRKTELSQADPFVDYVYGRFEALAAARQGQTT